MFSSSKTNIISEAEALPGRPDPIETSHTHYVCGEPLKEPFEDGALSVIFGMGCFWGAEKKFWQLPGVVTTAVGYSAGFTLNPTYQEVCSGQTGHNEVVLVVYRPQEIGFNELLKTFWEGHNPTQGMRQGNDAGTQYRSGIYTSTEEQYNLAQESKRNYQKVLRAANMGDITTEIQAAGEFYYAEDYHQQYLAKNPAGYCGLGGTGVTYAAAD
ncbi:MAG TPA: peptide-methionine (S)-S-oxide reductase [Gammaproteobacteria bacterium]|jgi:peptide-methionine (S)-S-oxide reductase|nr:peptide-methionine (S)-S-oxide reductase MsrA [Pseudomonadota bacterium]HAY44915.1 peptide-methionine (S)-S-oxide reductase [Gammaproteobacteria bacterium]